jgi:hypothetical protein
VTNKTGFGLDDRICWICIQLVRTVHKSLSDWTHHGNYSDFQLNCQLSIIVGFSLYRLGSHHSTENIRCLGMDICEPHRKHILRHRFYCCVHVLRALPRNGSTLLLVACLLRACLPRRSLAVGLHITMLL